MPKIRSLSAFSRNKKSKIIIFLSVIILFFIALFIYQSYAFYEVTNSYNIIKGKVGTFSSGDVQIAVKLQDKSGDTWLSTYSNATDFPSNSSGYYYQGTECDDPNIVEKSDWDYINYNFTNFILNNVTKPTKCNIKFGEITTKTFLMTTWSNNGIVLSDGVPWSTYSDSLNSYYNTLFKINDDYGTSYHFRGYSNYNYIKFGKNLSNEDIFWRIVRINGDGSIRLIYQKTESTGNGIGSSAFNSSYDNYDNNASVGYMYTIGLRQGLSESSVAKTTIESWFKTTFIDNSANATARSYIVDRIFCGDRTSSTNSSTSWPLTNGSTGGTDSTTTYYGAYLRLKTAKTPTLMCPEDADKYTTTASDHGNKTLVYPIGLITADEVIMAGAGTGGNYNHYLKDLGSIWTMSPSKFSSYSYVYYLYSNTGSIDDGRVDVPNSINPVINLSANTPLKGSGSRTSPFELDI